MQVILQNKVPLKTHQPRFLNPHAAHLALASGDAGQDRFIAALSADHSAMCLTHPIPYRLLKSRLQLLRQHRQKA